LVRGILLGTLLASALREVPQIGAATEVFAGAGQNDHAVLRVCFNFIHRTDHFPHELEANRVRAIGTIERQVADSFLALQDYCFVLHGVPRLMNVGYIANE
jgi:hypothetical protein